MMVRVFTIGPVELLVICGVILVFAAVVAVIIALVRSTRARNGPPERNGDDDSHRDGPAPPLPPIR